MEDSPMTPEERQRVMDFIRRSQADAMIRIDRLDQHRERFENNQKRFDKNQERFEQNQERFERNQARIEADIASLGRACGNLLKAARLTVERVRRLERSYEILTRIAASQSGRLDRLEGAG